MGPLASVARSAGASRRANAARAPIAAITPEAPASTRAARGSIAWLSQPAIGPPIGVEPRKTTEYSAITRPRIAGSAESWSEELMPAAKVTLAAPSGTSAIASSVRVGAPAAISAAAPKPNAAATSRPGPTRPRAPATRAPSTEPTPMATARTV